MKLDKAIELLNTAKEGWPVADVEKYYKALELGFEALKFKHEWDMGRVFPDTYHLPGESPEE